MGVGRMEISVWLREGDLFVKRVGVEQSGL